MNHYATTSFDAIYAIKASFIKKKRFAVSANEDAHHQAISRLCITSIEFVFAVFWQKELPGARFPIQIIKFYKFFVPQTKGKRKKNVGAAAECRAWK